MDLTTVRKGKKMTKHMTGDSEVEHDLRENENSTPGTVFWGQSILAKYFGVSKVFWGQVLQSYIWSSFFHPFETPAHRCIVHPQMRRDLVEPIAMLLVRLNDSSIVSSF